MPVMSPPDPYDQLPYPIGAPAPRTCPRCEGRGRVYAPLSTRCAVCQGTGVLPEDSLYREPED